MVLIMINYFDFVRQNELGYDVLLMNVSDGEILLSAYSLSDDGEITGESLDARLTGRRLTARGETLYLLDELRRHVRFSDMSCFGLSPTSNGYPYWVDINRVTRSGKAYPTLLDAGFPIKIIFPDTESTFMDCIICAPKSFAGEPFMVLSNLSDNQTLSENDEVMSGEIGVGVPHLTLSGPSKVEADAEVTLSIMLKENDLALESLYDIMLDCDCGYIPKRRIRLFTGTASDVKVQAQGLDAGDEITVTASMNGYGPVATWKIIVTAGQEA